MFCKKFQVQTSATGHHDNDAIQKRDRTTETPQLPTSLSALIEAEDEDNDTFDAPMQKKLYPLSNKIADSDRDIEYQNHDMVLGKKKTPSTIVVFDRSRPVNGVL